VAVPNLAAEVRCVGAVVLLALWAMEDSKWSVGLRLHGVERSPKTLTESAPNPAAVLPSQGVDVDRGTQAEDHVDDGNCRALMHRFMRAFP